MNKFTIIDAKPEDAPLIAWALMEAIGEDIVKGLAGNRSEGDVRGIFTRLARRTDTQYSYLNTRIAKVHNGEKVGVCISYNGGDIKQLRKTFFDEANKILEWNMSEEEMDSLPCETDGDEFYLDTLAILPEYRRMGIASALIMDARDKATKAGLPLGLLVADQNSKARKLYESVGFKPVGRRPFAGEDMDNMRMDRP